MRDVGRGCTAAAGGRNGQGCCDDGGDDGAGGAGGRQLLHDVDILRRDHDQQVVDGQIRRKIEARVEAGAPNSHLYRPVARTILELPPAAPRRQRAVRAARRVTRPPAAGTSAAEQRRRRAEPAHKASGGGGARHTAGWPARPFFINYPRPPERQTSSGRYRSYSAAGAVLSLIGPSGFLDRGAFSARMARLCIASLTHRIASSECSTLAQARKLCRNPNIH